MTAIGNNSPEGPGCHCNLFFSFLLSLSSSSFSFLFVLSFSFHSLLYCLSLSLLSLFFYVCSNECPKLVSTIKTDAATAHATEQGMMDSQRIRHACSTRLRISHPSEWDFALATKLTNCRASSDHHPDVSIPKTTNRALARGPTNSGLLPSPCCGQNDAVNLCGASSGSPITAQSADDPLNNGNPSTATSSLRASTCPGPGPSKSRSYQDVRGDAPARLPANARCCAFQSKPPLAQPCMCASCPVMAKDVEEWPHWKRRIKSTEDLGNKSGMWTMQLLRQFLLGNAPEPGMPRHPGKQIRLAERLMDSGRGLVLPPSPHTTRLEIFRLSIRSSTTSHGSEQLPPARGSLLESRRRGKSFQLSNQLCCNGWVSASYHWQAI